MLLGLLDRGERGKEDAYRFGRSSGGLYINIEESIITNGDIAREISGPRDKKPWWTAEIAAPAAAQVGAAARRKAQRNSDRLWLLEYQGWVRLELLGAGIDLPSSDLEEPRCESS